MSVRGITDSNGNETTVINAPRGIDTQNNFYSIDGDDLMDFYATASDLNLRDALISNAHIRPAGTMVMLNGEHLRIVNTTLDGLGAEDPNLKLGAEGGHGMARFNNINLINCNHGQVDIQNAIVDGLTVGGNATINLQGGQLNNFRVTEDSKVELRTQGGVLNRVKFEGAQFDDGSSFANAVVRGGEITNCSFDNVDFSRADISDVHITGGEISGNFNGARLANMSLRVDPREMRVSELTTFHNVNIYDPTLNQYRRVDNLDQFQAIQRSYDVMDQARNAGQTIAEAMAPARGADQAPAPSMANLGAALNQYSGTAVAENQNSQTLSSPEALAARNEVLAAAAMESFVSRS